MHRFRVPPAALLAVALACPAAAMQETPWMKDSAARLEKELAARHGEAVRPRLARGLKQVAAFWQTADGDSAAFEDFVRRNFAPDQPALDTLFSRCETLFRTA
jgi:hypothetical protein